MPVIRSSVRPKTSKQPWGTILKPDELSLGYAQHTRYEVDQIVERLYRANPPRARTDDASSAQSAATASTSLTRPFTGHTNSSRAGRNQTTFTREQVDEIVRAVYLYSYKYCTLFKHFCWIINYTLHMTRESTTVILYYHVVSALVDWAFFHWDIRPPNIIFMELNGFLWRGLWDWMLFLKATGF